jgi:hypothetical protein
MSRTALQTARYMREEYAGRRYSAHRRAADHAFSHDANTPGRRYWLAVAAWLTRSHKPERRRA